MWISGCVQILDGECVKASSNIRLFSSLSFHYHTIGVAKVSETMTLMFEDGVKGEILINNISLY